MKLSGAGAVSIATHGTDYLGSLPFQSGKVTVGTLRSFLQNLDFGFGGFLRFFLFDVFFQHIRVE